VLRHPVRHLGRHVPAHSALAHISGW
jgi:hypothetical protein